MTSPSKNALKPILRRVRQALIGDEWRTRIKPITWYNFPGWLWYTFKEDTARYKSSDRPISTTRLLHALKPSLANPIFIIGAPRSGTTFLGSCIAQIPDISYHFEPVLTKAATRHVYQGLWNEKFLAFFFKSTYAWLMRIHLDGDLRFAEKTPQVSLIVPFLKKTFPDAKFIHIVRDGRDSSISLSQKLWYQNKMQGSGAKEPGGYPLGPKARFWVEVDRIDEFETTNDLHRCMWLWRRYLEIILEATKDLSNDTYLEIRYEDLVNNTAEESARILDFLTIESQSSREAFSIFLAKQAKASSVNRWKAELSENTIDELHTEAGGMLAQLGYL